MNDVYTNDYHVVLTSSHDQLQLSVCRRHLVLARSTDDRIYCYGPRRNSDEVSFSADCFGRNSGKRNERLYSPQMVGEIKEKKQLEHQTNKQTVI